MPENTSGVWDDLSMSIKENKKMDDLLLLTIEEVEGRLKILSPGIVCRVMLAESELFLFYKKINNHWGLYFQKEDGSQPIPFKNGSRSQRLDAAENICRLLQCLSHSLQENIKRKQQAISTLKDIVTLFSTIEG